jgi:acrylyl-CoA reductase (NADPH)
MSSYPAVVLTEQGPARRVELTDADLPDGDVTVDVLFSSLNYKDGLAVSGKGKIARTLPMTCGIDLAGIVLESANPHYEPGDQVLATGWGMSETRPGGYTHRQRLPSALLTAVPAGLTLQQSMAIGTAGLTAMLCVMALERAGVGRDGEVLVTGAGGGVGSVAVALLSGLGYQVAASTGRPELHDYLRGLGAVTIVDRADLSTPGRPLDKERWAGAIDSVGGQTLASVLAQTRYGGAVAACGLASGSDLPTTVLPFILRGVRLLGVDSVMCPSDTRFEAWQRLSTQLPLAQLDAMTTVEPMSRIADLAEQILSGQTRGRVVIDTRA